MMIRAQDEVGEADSRPAGDGPLTWRFHSENVRTVAWASSEAFIQDAASVGDTLVQSVYAEDSLPVWGQSTAMLCAAIKGYNERLEPLSAVVDAAATAGATDEALCEARETIEDIRQTRGRPLG